MSSPPVNLPTKPLPPENYDCCGGGCADCELRLYGQKLKEWKKICDALPPAPPPAV